MGYLGRRIGKSQDQGDSNPAGANGAVGGGILDLFANGYFERQGDIYNAPGLPLPEGLEASGGIISDYTNPGNNNIYRSHVFSSSGKFEVTATGQYGNLVDFLLVAGGGGGGDGVGTGHGGNGGGGAGGYVEGNALPVTPTTTFTIVIGAGGQSTSNGGASNAASKAGGDSTIAGPTITTITAKGGGGGGEDNNDTIGNGGSGGGTWGGGGAGTSVYGQATQPGTNSLYGATDYGHNGGYTPQVAPLYCGGGGGGAGGAASPNPQNASGNGGDGRASTIAYGPPNPQTYAGGGGGSRGSNHGGGPNGNGGPGGGGPAGQTGEPATGGGGGGLPDNAPNVNLSGGGGIAVIRYQIGSITGQAKATGGAVSFYGGKTIHTFTSSGAFTAPGTFNETVVCVAVGGGGGGGVQHGGGGGAGGYSATEFTLNASGSPINAPIVVGGGGIGMHAQSSLAGTDGGHNNGTPTTAGFPGTPITAGHGGGGAQLGPPPGSPPGNGANVPLGSGGGGAMNQPGVTSDNKGTGGPQGYPGGQGITYSGGGVGGGGGGAGGAGGGPGSPNPEKGKGGIGVQVHPFFRDPAAAPSATTPTEPRHSSERGGGLGTPGPAGQFYLAGGGGGGAHVNWPYSVGPNKWGADGGSGGGGKGGNNTPGSETQYHPGTSGLMSTGGGGGSSGPNSVRGGAGGSGIVLVAYPT